MKTVRAIILLIVLSISSSTGTNAVKLAVHPKLDKRAIQIGNLTSNLHGLSVTGYYVSIQIGTPAQHFKVVVDTGSSNLAVAGTPAFSTSHFYDKDLSNTADLSHSYSVETTYTEGSWKGLLLYDVVSIPTAQVTTAVHMPVTEITSAKNFFISDSDWQGILGLGYSTLVQPMDKNIPSVMKSITAGSNLHNIFAVQLCSNPLNESTSGSLIIGSFDTSLSVGEMRWTNIVREWYYEVIITSMMVGDVKIDVPCSSYNQDKTIVDSGTTNLRFPTVVYHKIIALLKKHVKAYVFDDEFYNKTKLYCTTEVHELDSWFPTLTINMPSTFEDKTISLIVYPSSYIQIAGTAGNGKTCYQFTIHPSTTGTVLGTIVMEQYYVVFDREKQRIGFARSACTWIDDKLPVLQVISEWTDPSTCRNISKKSNVLLIVMGIFLFVLLMAAVALVYIVKKNSKNGFCCCKKLNRYSELSNL